MTTFRGRGLVSAAAASTVVLAMAACSSDTPSDPTAKPSLQAVIDLGHLFLCKVGTDATFSLTVNAGAPSQLTVANGTCVDAVQSPVGNANVTITELVDANTDSTLIKARRQERTRYAARRLSGTCAQHVSLSDRM